MFENWVWLVGYRLKAENIILGIEFYSKLDFRCFSHYDDDNGDNEVSKE